MYDSSSKFTQGETGRITPDPYVSLNELVCKIEVLLQLGILHNGKALEDLLAGLTWYAADDFRGGGVE